MKRRQILWGVTGLLGYGAIAPNQAWAAEPAKPLFSLPPLPYGYDALEPYIDQQTMTIHHDRHHAAYVSKLNQGFAQFGITAVPSSLENLIREIKLYPEGLQNIIRDHGGGHLNHSIFWQTMAPAQADTPQGSLATELAASFGSLTDFQAQFNQVGTRHFGSGWVWLARNPTGKLEILSTKNQDSPLLNGSFPILGNDLWEHAYYLKYQNHRLAYLQAWWQVVNWAEVAKRHQASLA
ncbi:MAG: superoxide dismutase [Pseudanabaenaceae cyanobacterium bins.68]|nr:superoxide dismutase [Pseudanabaenaceae cyanobacterium bins.68]